MTTINKEIKLNDPVRNEYALNSLIRVDSLNENAIPYVTDLLISEVTGFTKKYVDEKIRTHKKRLLELGVLLIETAKPTSKNGGRPQKVYKLNQKQAIFLCNTFDDSEFILDFKSELADAFIDAIYTLNKRQLIHDMSKQVTKTLTDAIKDSDVLSGGKAYINIWNVIYKVALNKTTYQVKKEHNIPKGKNVLEYLSVDELSAVNKVKSAVIGLISLNLTCKEIEQALAVIKNRITIDRPKELMLPMVI